MKTWYNSANNDFKLFNGDCLDVLSNINTQFDMIFADPPYFLSNGGISVQSGKRVCVDKGVWDKSQGFYNDNKFNYKWISLCRKCLKDNGTIWISGTFHNIFSVANILNELKFKILNCVVWVKTNPPPNLACRCFTHSHEMIVWARKEKNNTHYYNYELMKTMNGNTQMKDVWCLPAISRWEKSCGKHPTQKPLSVLSRIILASTKEDDLILDPFTGSSTTGISANLFNRQFIGIDNCEEFLKISKLRRQEIDDLNIRKNYKNNILQTFKGVLCK